MREVGTIAVEAGLQTYLRQINDTPLLTAEEEKRLAQIVRRGREAARLFAERKLNILERERAEEDAHAAREQMVKANLRLVVNIAKRYAKRGMPLNDLINEGNLGLIRAVEMFDPDQNTRFSTYASWWIKQSIKRSLINSDKPIHIPAYMVEMISRFREARDKFIETHGRAPTMDELAEAMALSASKMDHIRSAVKAVSTSTQDLEGENGLGLTEELPDHRSVTPEEELIGETELTTAIGLVEALSERERTILQLRYGLDGAPPLTLKEIGVKIDLTRERVRQIECEALEKLRAALER